MRGLILAISILFLSCRNSSDKSFVGNWKIAKINIRKTSNPWETIYDVKDPETSKEKMLKNFSEKYESKDSVELTALVKETINKIKLSTLELRKDSSFNMPHSQYIYLRQKQGGFPVDPLNGRWNFQHGKLQLTIEDHLLEITVLELTHNRLIIGETRIDGIFSYSTELSRE